MFNKRGVESETVHVTGLIVLMGILIALYMLLIPPDAQRQILEKGSLPDSYNYPAYSQGTTDNNKIRNILLESPGLIFPDSSNKEKIDINSVNLFSTTSQKVINLGNSVSVSRSLLNNNFQDLSFKLDDLTNINGLKLFFNTLSSKGSLIIYLNGQVVSKGIISNEKVPLEIPIQNIKNDNTLRFEVSSPSWRFLSVNKYDLKDVKIIKEAKSENKKEVRNFQAEKDKINKAKLTYFINCLKLDSDQGILKVLLNNFNVHLGQVICDASQQTVDIPKNYFNDQNKLSFESDKGNYVIEQIQLELNSDRSKAPTYFFDAKAEDLNNQIMLKMDLIPNKDDERSSATIIINDERITLDTDKNLFSRDISSLIKEGENFIKIVPRNEFEIVSLEIFTK